MSLSGGSFNAWASHAWQPVGTWIWHSGQLPAVKEEAAACSEMNTLLAANINGILSSYQGTYYVMLLNRQCFASSPRKPYFEDKRMVLEHTHGLFIT
jgi:hypothetical protein